MAMVASMVANDLKAAEKERLVRQGGGRVPTLTLGVPGDAGNLSVTHAVRGAAGSVTS